MIGYSINLCGMKIARRDLQNTNRKCHSLERNVQTYSVAIFQLPWLACIAWNEVELTMNDRYLEWCRRELSEGTVPSFGCGDQGNPWQTWTKCSWADSRVKVWKFFIVSGTGFVPIFRMGAESVPERLEIFHTLTLLSAREHFVEVCRHKCFKACYMTDLFLSSW